MNVLPTRVYLSLEDRAAPHQANLCTTVHLSRVGCDGWLARPSEPNLSPVTRGPVNQHTRTLVTQLSPYPSYIESLESTAHTSHLRITCPSPSESSPDDFNTVHMDRPLRPRFSSSQFQARQSADRSTHSLPLSTTSAWHRQMNHIPETPLRVPPPRSPLDLWCGDAGSAAHETPEKTIYRWEHRLQCLLPSKSR